MTTASQSQSCPSTSTTTVAPTYPACRSGGGGGEWGARGDGRELDTHVKRKFRVPAAGHANVKRVILNKNVGSVLAVPFPERRAASQTPSDFKEPDSTPSTCIVCIETIVMVELSRFCDS
jgi:hypothetical protein